MSFLFLLGERALYFWSTRSVELLDYLNGNFVSSGAAFDLDRHGCSLSYFFIFTAARNFALRARGLKTDSLADAVNGRLVRICNAASYRSPP